MERSIPIDPSSYQIGFAIGATSFETWRNIWIEFDFELIRPKKNDKFPNHSKQIQPKV